MNLDKQFPNLIGEYLENDFHILKNSSTSIELFRIIDINSFKIRFDLSLIIEINQTIKLICHLYEIFPITKDLVMKSFVYPCILTDEEIALKSSMEIGDLIRPVMKEYKDKLLKNRKRIENNIKEFESEIGKLQNANRKNVLMFFENLLEEKMRMLKENNPDKGTIFEDVFLMVRFNEFFKIMKSDKNIFIEFEKMYYNPDLSIIINDEFNTIIEEAHKTILHKHVNLEKAIHGYLDRKSIK